MSNVIFVSKSGNDTTGNGTLANPYLTIGKAQTVAAGIATALVPVLIQVALGTYAENIAILPFVTIAGMAADDFSVYITGTITLDPSWATPPSGAFPVAAIENCQLQGTVNLDCTTHSIPEASIAFCNCDFENTFTAIGFASGGLNGVVFDKCSLQDCSLCKLTGLFCESYLSNFANLSCLSTATLESRFVSSGDQLGIGPGTGGSTLTVDASAGKGSEFYAFGTAVVGSLVVNGSLALYAGTAGAVPPAPTISGGAPVPTLMTRANGIGYLAAVPGNWVSPAPTTIAKALDRIAANTANAHPIP